MMYCSSQNISSTVAHHCGPSFLATQKRHTECNDISRDEDWDKTCTITYLKCLECGDVRAIDPAVDRESWSERGTSEKP